MEAGFEGEVSVFFDHAVQAVVVDEQLVVDEELAAVVGADVEGVDSVGGEVDEAFEFQGVMFVAFSEVGVEIFGGAGVEGFGGFEVVEALPAAFVVGVLQAGLGGLVRWDGFGEIIFGVSSEVCSGGDYGLAGAKSGKSFDGGGFCKGDGFGVSGGVGGWFGTVEGVMDFGGGDVAG